MKKLISIEVPPHVSLELSVEHFSFHRLFGFLLTMSIVLLMVVKSLAVAPPRVTDLTPSNVKGTQLTLGWTVPTGTPAGATFEVRYSLSPTSITALNWNTRTVVSAPPPNNTMLAAGSKQYIGIAGLTTYTNYCFAMRVRNSANEVSTISNIIWVMTNGQTAKVDMAWDAAVDEKLGAASNYFLVAEAVDDPGDKVTISVGNVTSATITGLTWGVQYKINAYAKYPIGDERGDTSGLSNTVLYTPGGNNAENTGT